MISCASSRSVCLSIPSNRSPASYKQIESFSVIVFQVSNHGISKTCFHVIPEKGWKNTYKELVKINQVTSLRWNLFEILFHFCPNHKDHIMTSLSKHHGKNPLISKAEFKLLNNNWTIRHKNDILKTHVTNPSVSWNNRDKSN